MRSFAVVAGHGVFDASEPQNLANRDKRDDQENLIVLTGVTVIILLLIVVNRDNLVNPAPDLDKWHGEGQALALRFFAVLILTWRGTGFPTPYENRETLMPFPLLPHA